MFGRSANLQESANRLYAALVAQAREPFFYTECGVPDSIDGRYDMIVIHAFLAMRRLGAETGADSKEAARLSQALFDFFMADMDQNLREMGVGDLGVGRRVKVMAKGFYGRVAAYEQGFAGTDAELAGALRRNLYGTMTGSGAPDAAALARMAAYMRRSMALMSEISVDDLRSGRPRFAALDR